MMFLPSKVVIAPIVDSAGARVAVTLPDGPGYYRLVRFANKRTDGANSATRTPILWDDDSGSELSRIWVGAAVASGTPLYWPSAAIEADPGRFGISLDGTWYLTWGADVSGDTWTASLIVIRVR